MLGIVGIIHAIHVAGPEVTLEGLRTNVAYKTFQVKRRRRAEICRRLGGKENGKERVKESSLVFD